MSTVSTPASSAAKTEAPAKVSEKPKQYGLTADGHLANQQIVTILGRGLSIGKRTPPKGMLKRVLKVKKGSVRPDVETTTAAVVDEIAYLVRLLAALTPSAGPDGVTDLNTATVATGVRLKHSQDGTVASNLAAMIDAMEGEL